MKDEIKNPRRYVRFVESLLRILRLCERILRADSRDTWSRYEILTLDLTFFKLRVLGLKRRSKMAKRRPKGRKSGF